MLTQSLSADGELLTLNVTVSDLRVDGTDASVHLYVDLRHHAAGGDEHEFEGELVARARDGSHGADWANRRAGRGARRAPGAR